MQLREHFKEQSQKKSKETRLAAGLVLVASLVVCGCGLEKPESPHWTVDMRVPIANRHVDGPYIAAHAGSDYLKWHDDSGLVWTIGATLDTITLAGHLTANPPSASGTFPLGLVRVGAGIVLTSEIALTDVTALAAGVVPEFTTELNAAFPQAGAFDSLSGASGLLRLNLENELGVSIDQVTITLYAGGVTPIAQISVNQSIPTGTTRTVEQQLSNIALGDDWRAELGFHTPGGTVLTAADKFIAVHASFPNGMSATYARGMIDTTSRLFSDSFILSETHELSSASIASGVLTIAWTNSTALPIVVSWNTPEITVAGVPFSGEATIAPWASAGMPIDMAGAQYTGAADPSAAAVNVLVQSTGSTGQVVEVSGDQTIDYTLNWSTLTLSVASGHIAATQFQTGLLTAAVAWDDGLEDAGLDSWAAFLTVTSSLPLAAQVSGTITSNTGLNLPFSGTVPARGSLPATVRLPLLHADAPLHPMPSELRFEGTVLLGDNGDTVSINASDFVSATVELSAPAHMYVDSVSLDVEPSSVSLSSDDFGDRTGRLRSATVTLTVANRFPLGGQFTLRIASDSLAVLGSDALVFGPSSLLPANTDATGSAISARETVLTYDLDSADLRLFEHDVVWFAESLTLLGPGQGQPARISASDVLDWHAEALMEINVDGDVRPWEQ